MRKALLKVNEDFFDIYHLNKKVISADIFKEVHEVTIDRNELVNIDSVANTHMCKYLVDCTGYHLRSSEYTIIMEIPIEQEKN